MKASARVVTPLVRLILGSICRVDARELRAVPRRGPLIIVTNHINFLEVPLIRAWLHPRRAIGLVKAETWRNPALGFLAEAWEAIAIDREGTDLAAMRRALEALERGDMLIIAPEGTRSGHGRLQKGHGGVVQLAIRSGAPILPIAHFGGERFWGNLRACRRTRFRFKVGEPYRLVAPSGGMNRSVRDEMTLTIMNSISALLPERYRGVYPDPESDPRRCAEPAALLSTVRTDQAAILIVP